MQNEKRLIDANELERRLLELGGEPDYQHSGEDWGVGVCMAEGIVDEMPTVDAVEVVHGRWEFGELDVLGQPVRCSVCGWGRDKVNKAMWLEYPAHKYCGNCGAKMDGDGNG